jgi:hypothetical protein
MTVFTSEGVNAGTEGKAFAQWDTDFVSPVVTAPYVNSLPIAWSRPGQLLIDPFALVSLAPQPRHIMEEISPSHEIGNDLKNSDESLVGSGLCQAVDISRPDPAILGHISGHGTVMEIARSAKR